MNEETLILNSLLDKYEKSKHFSQPGHSKQRVLLKPERNDLKEYDFQNIVVRDRFNAALERLKASALIHVTWLKGREHLVASEIWLNLDMLDDAYAVACRQPLRAQLFSLCQLLESASKRVSSAWLKAHLADKKELLLQSNKISGLYKKGEQFLAELLVALEYYDKLAGTDTTMRAFSIVCYHDSKRFERVYRDSFLAEMRTAHPGLKELLAYHELSPREQLDYLGIHVRPEIFEFCGAIQLETPLGQCDFSALNGCALTSTATSSVLRIQSGSIARILFIENKTNYDEYIEKERQQDELVVYHGGFMSAQKKSFFKKIALSAASDTQIHFWADIDLGGFKMFYHLNAIIPQLEPWRMSGKDVEQYSAQGLERSQEYLHTLKIYQHLPEAELFSDAINAILSCGRTIEQESMLLISHEMD